MEYISIIFDLLLTAGIYCIIPLAVASLCKTSIQKKKYLIICIVGEAVIAFVFQHQRISSGISGSSFPPAILWGTIFYDVGLSILRKRNRLSDCTPPKHTEQPPVEFSTSTSQQPPRSEVASSFVSQDISPAPSTSPPPITETWYTCPACGSLVASGGSCDLWLLSPSFFSQATPSACLEKASQKERHYTLCHRSCRSCRNYLSLLF